MKHRLSLSLLLPLSLVPFVAVSASSPRPSVVAIAGLLGGNTLVPIAQFAVGRWERTWPRPDEQVEMTFGKIEELPKAWFPAPGGVPSEWFLWTEDIHGVPLRAGAPVLGQAHCLAVWGLSTRLQPFDHETTAIATNVQSGIRPFETSRLGAFSDARLTALLRAAFEKSETEAIRLKRTDAKTMPAHRPAFEPIYQLRCVQTARDSDEFCSFAATRPLGAARSAADSACDEVVVVQGWVAKTGQDFTLLKADATLTDCDAKELRTSSPLVLVSAGSRTFIVVREHGYEDESFVVFEVRGRRLERVLEVPGGGG
jgi:hypothetical protein